MQIEKKNIDTKVINDFGMEWQYYNQGKLGEREAEASFRQYFSIFPFDKINNQSEGFDMGCGSGRWAKFISPHVRKLNCIEPSILAINEAKINLENTTNCHFECASTSSTTLKHRSQDFGYSLGVLHHIPDTLEGIKDCGKLLKSGAPFLLYIYYRFDTRPKWFKLTWKITDLIRKFISRMPFNIKIVLSQLIAYFVYFPLSRFSKILEKFSINIKNIPLSYYRNKSIYSLKTDALDRFGTTLEKRYTKKEIEQMLIESGFHNIRFNDAEPYWVALAFKK